jgi:hypothetical protein
MPTASFTYLAIAAARNLPPILQHPSPASPLSLASDSQIAALQQLAGIFATVTTVLTTPFRLPARRCHNATGEGRDQTHPLHRCRQHHPIPEDTSTPTADISTAKRLFNSVLSAPN